MEAMNWIRRQYWKIFFPHECMELEMKDRMPYGMIYLMASPYSEEMISIGNGWFRQYRNSTYKPFPTGFKRYWFQFWGGGFWQNKHYYRMYPLWKSVPKKIKSKIYYGYTSFWLNLAIESKNDKFCRFVLWHLKLDGKDKMIEKYGK